MRLFCPAKLAFVLWFCALGSVASAACTFPTYAHRDELADPSHIEHISVEIKKSRKWFKNSISILASDRKTIGSEFKKKQRAIVTVRYSFGSCSYSARVRQNGDWKDHIKLLPGGNVISSLDVKLEQGNILNAVRFKLLIPETRNGVNEVLGAFLLQELGYISPETFLVPADINGVHQTLLFQENAEKELLERRLRREGPIFEGDESLLWDFGGFHRFVLEDISLARQSNAKWAEKGETSTQISLEAFKRIQTAYTLFASNDATWNHNHGVGLVPNTEIHHPEFENYALVLLAMHGGHALRPHNVKVYFNSFTQTFEPIYYDGNIDVLNESYLENFSPNFAQSRDFYIRFASPEVTAQIIDRIDLLVTDLQFKQDFLDRAGADREAAGELFDEALPTISDRLRGYHAKSVENRGALGEKFPEDMASLQRELIARTKDHGIDVQYVQILGKTDDGNFVVQLAHQESPSRTFELAPLALVELMSDNNIEGTRTTLLADPAETPVVPQRTMDFLAGEIVLSEGAGVEVSHPDRSIVVSQASPTDWVLIRNVQLTDWTISFEGAAQDTSIVAGQRFNEFGLTGCLNFYNVTFEGVRISGRNGQCEDSVNIVSSEGSLKELYVEDGFADAIDIDFASIEIESLRVERTGNDCFDVSTGNFMIGQATLHKCGDKGISVGENSQLSAVNVDVADAAIGVSSKDFSRVNIDKFTGSGIDVCVEAFQKKQEFGGGELRVDAYHCSGDVNQDASSIIVLNELTQ